MYRIQKVKTTEIDSERREKWIQEIQVGASAIITAHKVGHYLLDICSLWYASIWTANFVYFVLRLKGNGFLLCVDSN